MFLMPMGLFGPLTGTNNAVSSGAHFGVRGRIVGSFLSLLTAIAFYSISVWVSGDALVGALRRLFGIPDTDILRAAVYAILGSLVIVVVVFGYQFMLLINKIVVIGNTVLILLGIFAYGGSFHAGYGGSDYALGSFWPTFILSALVVMGNPISFGAFLGDWARYIPSNTPRRPLLLATVAAQACTLVPFLFGVATATIVAGQSDYVVALIKVSPLWYAVLIILVAFLGGLSTGITSLYGTGLDFASVFPMLSRVQASLFIGAFAFIFILVGRLAFNLLDSVNAFIGAIVLCTTPWMIIMTLGFIFRRGFYRPRDLQVFNMGMKGGPYWYRNGVNWRGMAAWIPSAVIALLFANYPPLIEGPARNVAGGVDISLLVAIGLAAVLYVVMLLVFPEPRYVFGPDGPRVVRSVDGEEPRVEVDPTANRHRQLRQNREQILDEEEV